MFLSHVMGMFLHPQREWEKIRDEDCTIASCYFGHVLILAAIPPVSGYIGTTQIGWSFGDREPIMLTAESASVIATLYYIALLIGVFSVGFMIHWMSQTYGGNKVLADAVSLAAYTATPLFLIGLMEINPVLWLNFVIGLPALAYSVYLLYSGVPIVMEIPEEKGFLFSSAVLAVGLVALVTLLAVTALLWGSGFAPAFTH